LVFGLLRSLDVLQRLTQIGPLFLQMYDRLLFVTTGHSLAGCRRGGGRKENRGKRHPHDWVLETLEETLSRSPGDKECADLTFFTAIAYCAVRIVGTISTEPRLANVEQSADIGNSHKTFLFANDSDNSQISCMASGRFSGTVPSIGTRVNLVGDLMQTFVSAGQQIPVFMFDQIS
jgi:hypothetical protein